MSSYQSDIIEEVQHDKHGFAIGDNDVTIALDSAISKGGESWDVLKSSIIGVNILTLIRNALSSFDKSITDTSAIDKFNSEDVIREVLVPRILTDIDNLKLYLEDVHDASIKIYLLDYHTTKMAKVKNFKVPKTEKQKATHTITQSVIKHLNSVIVSRGKYVPSGVKYIISHMVYDIITAPYHVKVIESHTGAIKDRHDLNTKLNLKDNERYIVPLTMPTYLIYGDGVLLNKNVTLSSKITDKLTTGRITPLSPESRVIMCIKNTASEIYNILKLYLE